MLLDQTILDKWLDAKGDEALKKLLNNEPLTFEDHTVFCLVGQREETRALRLEMERRFEQVDKRFDQIERRFEQVDKRFDDGEKRWEQRFSALEDQITDLKIEVRDVKAELGAINRRIDDIRKEINAQTWKILGLVTLLAALIKLFDVLK